MKNNIDLKYFNALFEGMLNAKEDANIVKGRYDIETVQLDKKSIFVIDLLNSIKEITSITYKLLFWENDKKINDFFNTNFQDIDYKIVDSYSNTEIPGVAYVDDAIFNKDFMKGLLDVHFNYELGVLPSFNLRVQICVNSVDSFMYLLDVYDDRGFDIYFHPAD